MASFEEILAQQEYAMNAVRRMLPNFKKLGQAKWTAAVIKHRLTTLETAFRECQELDFKIQIKATEVQKANHNYFVGNIFSRCEDLYNESADFIVNALGAVESSRYQSVTEAKPQARSAVNLPRIDLPTFDGTYTLWESFRDRFSSLIHNDQSISNVEKMHYLLSSLKGDALSVLTHLAVTDTNYDVAWKILVSRFENKRQLVTEHLHKFLNLPTLTAESSKGLRNLRDSSNAAIQALVNLQRPVHSWPDLIIVLMLKKLDRNTRRAWELKLGDSVEFPEYNTLDQFLESRIRALDAMQMESPSTEKADRASPAGRYQSRRIAALHASASDSAKVAPASGLIKCPMCSNNHPLYRCSKFLGLSVDQRIIVVREHTLCQNCLFDNHHTERCRSLHRCHVCSGRHHTLIHPPVACDNSQRAGENRTRSEETIVSNLLSPTRSRFTSVLLATARVRIATDHGRSMIARALLDQGSSATIISERAAQALKAPRRRCSFRVAGINGAESSVRHTVGIEISAPHASDTSYRTTAIVLSSLTRYAPEHVRCATDQLHIRHLQLADSDPFSSDPIELIIGADLYGQLLRSGTICGSENELTAQNTVFGWILSGRIPSNNESSTVQTCNLTLLENIDSQLRRFWEVEEIPNSSPLTSSEQECENHFMATHCRDPQGRYIVRLPFRAQSQIEFGDSRTTAVRSLLRLERRLQSREGENIEYRSFLADYEQLGHMQSVPREMEPSRSAYYIPHHGVVREHSSTTQLRVVFNASAPATNGQSLNEHLAIGPKLQTDLPAVILRWRQYSVALTADIEKMYRQILIHPDDVDYQRIVWRSTPTEPIKDYRLCTVTYGTTSAPFLALRVIKQLIADEGRDFPLACAVLRDQTYVDDCLFGADDVELANQARQQLNALLVRGGFRLRKWASNSAEALYGIDAADHGLALDKELSPDDSLHVLGIAWRPAQDVLHFQLKLGDNPGNTKREILSTISRFYDPLGWLASVLVTAKILIQKLWAIRCDWDHPIPQHLQIEWDKYYSELSILKHVQIPRWTGSHSKGGAWELHGFSDASTHAYAAAIYIRHLPTDSQPSTTLLIAKSKVAPLKTISVPRLELCAALLLARLSRFVTSTLSQSPSSVFCWTDSTIVLAWLQQPPTTWKTFVANRVSLIQELTATATWRHVPTTDNPADDASRGIFPRDIIHKPLWWYGPSWLRQRREEWPELSGKSSDGLSLERRGTAILHVTPASAGWDLQSRYSSWSKLLRVTAYILRFISRLRSRQRSDIPLDKENDNLPSCAVQLDQFQNAKLYWIKSIQRDVCAEEIVTLSRGRTLPTSNPLSILHPYIDSSGLLRVGGRLRFACMDAGRKHPILLKAHPLVALIIKHHHHATLHGGSQLTLASLRGEFWIIRARSTVRSVIHRCLECARERVTPSSELMGDLPRARITRSARAFEHAGVDYAGPISVRTAPGRGHKSHKAYIALFICLTVKAIHLELVSDYTTAAFLAAFHRFTSRRGTPTAMYSDNGTTFQGADREMQATYARVIRDNDLQNQMTEKTITWHFIPPSAPHFGGLWEAGIKSVKYHLRRCIGKHTLTFEEMSTLLCRIEACLNSRPLGSASDDLDDQQILTPGHFLIGTALLTPPEPSLLHVNEQRLSRWQLLQQITETFWKAWSTDYLQTLQQRPKWRSESRLAKLGRIVLVRNSNAPPSHWELGRIIACHPGEDGITRVVTVKTSRSEYIRPIVKLSFLPIDINDEELESLTAGGKDDLRVNTG